MHIHSTRNTLYSLYPCTASPEACRAPAYAANLHTGPAHSWLRLPQAIHPPYLYRRALYTLSLLYPWSCHLSLCYDTCHYFRAALRCPAIFNLYYMCKKVMCYIGRKSPPPRSAAGCDMRPDAPVRAGTHKLTCGGTDAVTWRKQ